MKQRRVLVTGADGRIGQALIPHLRDSGHDVVALGRRAPSLRAGSSANCRYVEWDLRVSEPQAGSEDALEAITDLVHGAAVVDEPSCTGRPASDLIRANVTGMIHLLRKLPAVQRIVFISSVAVYGPPKVRPCGENHPLAPTRLYGVSKALAEDLLRMYARRTKTSLTVLRVASAYGFYDPRLTGGAIPTLLRRCSKGQSLRLVSSAGLLRDYIHIDDVSRAVGSALSSHAGGTFNVASGTGVSLLDVARVIGLVAGCDPRVEIDPDLQPDSDFVTDVTYDISRARDMQGFAPATTLADGIAALYRGYQPDAAGE